MRGVPAGWLGLAGRAGSDPHFLKFCVFLYDLHGECMCWDSPTPVSGSLPSVPSGASDD